MGNSCPFYYKVSGSVSCPRYPTTVDGVNVTTKDWLNWPMESRAFTREHFEGLMGCLSFVKNWQSLHIHINKLATVVEGDPKVHFSLATTQSCRGGCCSFSRIVLLYPWYVPYNAECKARSHQVPFFESFELLNLRVNLGLLGHW